MEEIMEKCVGRPKSQMPKDVKYTVRLSYKETITLDVLAKRTGKSWSELIRDGIHLMYKNANEKNVMVIFVRQKPYFCPT